MKILDVLLADAYNGKLNWVFLLRNLLQTCGFGHVWQNQGVENDSMFLKVFKDRVRDNFGQTIQRELRNSSRGKLYILYQEHFICATYLNVVKTANHRRALCRLRSSNHRLAIESGRWHKPHPIPIEDRKCSICNDLEDEYHFVLICSVYRELRKKYIPKYYYSRPNMLKYIELMSCENPRTVRNLANFTYKAFKLRDSQLNALL